MKQSEKWKRGLPYVGNKNQLAKGIFEVLPDGKRFVDVFGGGGSMSLHALDTGKYENVLYNELDFNIFRLFKTLLTNSKGLDLLSCAVPDRSEFIGIRDRFKNGEEITLIETVKLITWSFSNDMNTFLYGSKPIERFDGLSTEEFKVGLTKKALINFEGSTITELREACQPLIIAHRDGRRLELEQLEQLERLEQVERLVQLERLGQLERLENLDRLERLEQTDLGGLDFTNLDYRSLTIKNDDVVYLDPPYTHEGGKSDLYRGVPKFELDSFVEWYSNLPAKEVYISGYEQLPNTVVVWSKVKHTFTAKTKRREELLMKVVV